MKKKDKQTLADAVECEGFEYAFIYYSSWEEIKDPVFHRLLQQYRQAHKALNDYIK